MCKHSHRQIHMLCIQEAMESKILWHFWNFYHFPGQRNSDLRNYFSKNEVVFRISSICLVHFFYNSIHCFTTSANFTLIACKTYASMQYHSWWFVSTAYSHTCSHNSSIFMRRRESFCGGISNWHWKSYSLRLANIVCRLPLKCNRKR